MWKGSNKLKSLAVDFTVKCNLKCNYCYLYSKQEIQKKEIPIEQLIDSVLKTISLFPSIDIVELWGGESTYNPERLYKFCKAMYDVGIKTWIPSTNGTLIDKYEVYDAWRYCNQTYTSQISFDGNPKYHNLNRNNSFDKVVSNIHFAIKQQVPVSLRTTYGFNDFLSALNENFIWYPEIYKRMLNDQILNTEIVNRTFAISEYCDRKFMMIYQEIDTIFTKEEILKKANTYREYYKILKELVKNYWDNEVIFLPPYINDTVKALISDNPESPKTCGSFFSQLYLHTPTGDIYPCLSQDVSEYQSIARLANIHTKEINWNILNTIRSFMYRRNRMCATCFMQSSCFGGCYHLSPSSVNTFNSYWNTYNIPKCKFAKSIFDIVIETSQELISHINPNFNKSQKLGESNG